MSINPNQIIVPLNLNLDQINLVLNSLAKQPYEAVAELVLIIRQRALHEVNAAEQQAKAEADAQVAEKEVIKGSVE